MSESKSLEVIDSIKKTISDRLSSPIWGVFVLFNILLHWDVFYTTFFVSEDRIWMSSGLLKVEYVSQLLYPNFWWNFVGAIVLTGLTIYVLPTYILLPAFKKNEEYECEKKRVKLENDQKLEGQRLDLVRVKEKRRDTMIKAETAGLSSEMKEWELDYQRLKDTKYYSEFGKEINALIDRSRAEEQLTWSKDALMYYKINNFLDVRHIGSPSPDIWLTAKGRYIAKRYLQDKAEFESLDAINF